MQRIFHAADNTNLKIEYVYRQTSLFFLLYILKYRKDVFYAYEQANVIYAKKLSKPKTITRTVASCNFYWYLNALHFMKNVFCIKFWITISWWVCMFLIGLTGPVTKSRTQNIFLDKGSAISDSQRIRWLLNLRDDITSFQFSCIIGCIEQWRPATDTLTYAN